MYSSEPGTDLCLRWLDNFCRLVDRIRGGPKGSVFDS